MRALKGGIPRAYGDSRSVVARVYREYCAAFLAAWGPLPRAATSMLREAGRAHVELQRLAADLEAARNHRRLRDSKSIRRQQFALREQLGRLESRMQELVQNRNGNRGPSLADVMAGDD